LFSGIFFTQKVIRFVHNISSSCFGKLVVQRSDVARLQRHRNDRICFKLNVRNLPG